MIDAKREQIQTEALTAWLNNNKIGTIELVTGLGKTFILLRAILTMPQNCNVLLLAETTLRERNIYEDSEKFKLIYGVNPLTEHAGKVIFMCYQSAHKYKLEDLFENVSEENTIVGLDEIHDMLTLQYSKFASNNLQNKIPRMGLSATVDRKSEYIIDDEVITKYEMLQSFCPIVYKYTISQGQEEGTSRKLKMYIILHQLDKKNKNIISGSKEKPFYNTEYDEYQYRDSVFKRNLFIPKNNKSRDFLIRNAASRRARLLYSLPSKIFNVKLLLRVLQGKTLVFGNDVDELMKITPNTISSRYNKKQNNELLTKFQNDEIKLLASFKMLEQGANLKGLDNIVFHSYYGKIKSTIQRLGRARLDGDKVANIFIFITENTQEMKWFYEMTDGMRIEQIWCKNIDDAINKYLK